MLDLKDFFHLPEVDDLFAQIAGDDRGVTVVAGLGPRALTPTGTGTLSGRPTIAAILMRHILDRRIGERSARAVVVAPDRRAMRVARHQRRQVEFAGGLGQALQRDPDLLVVDQLDAAIAPAVFDAAARCRVLTQIDTSLSGGEVLRQIAELGCGPDQLARLAWVVTTQRVAALCPACKQPHQPAEALLAMMSERYDLDRAAAYYGAAGCDQCGGTGYRGEVTAFDVFHGDGTTRYPELASLPSRLSIDQYMARLAEHGYVALEDAARIGAATLRKVQQLLATREETLDETARALQRKLAELEAANAVLTQRTEALIALQDVSQTLSASTRLNQVADRVVHYACLLCGADRAVLYLIEPAFERAGRVLAVAGWDGSAVGRVVELPESMLARTEPDAVSGPPPAIVLPPDQARAIQTGLRLPLVADEELVGLLIVSSLGKARFAPGQVALLKTFGSQAAVSIQRVRLIETLREKIAQLEAAQAALVEKERLARELELARDLQLRSLPDRFPEVAGVHFASAYRPAREVGGDLYDVIDLGDGQLGLLIADVSDKGLPAAFFMALTRSLTLAEARRSLSPREVLSNVNRLLREVNRAGMFVTMFYGVFDTRTRRLVYGRAGHDRPLWLRADGSVEPLDAPGILVGLLDHDEFYLTEADTTLAPGDALILYTDGMVDALDPNGVEFGAQHWVSRVRDYADLPADELCSALFDEVAAFQLGTPQMDDMTLLVMRIVDF
jgi:sigma-B regulation protein RsbU (phosphoserine phosphatase)